MSRSGGQSEAKTPNVKSPSKLGTHLLKGLKTESTLPSPRIEPRTCAAGDKVSFSLGLIGSLLPEGRRKSFRSVTLMEFDNQGTISGEPNEDTESLKLKRQQ
ncbi:hypothetical protein TNCV_4442271 [Trichonephila clavipes]|nr:hypothetical protein TNCV_4442271 [Trichonephila clavipes]